MWRYGIFVGRALESDQNFIALADGTITRARAMVRVIPSLRWDAPRVEAICATPLQERPTSLDTIEAEPNPHDHPETEQPPEDAESIRAKRRLKIELRDLKRHGYSPGCPKCDLYRRGKTDAAKKEHH